MPGMGGGGGSVEREGIVLAAVAKESPPFSNWYIVIMTAFSIMSVVVDYFGLIYTCCSSKSVVSAIIIIVLGCVGLVVCHLSQAEILPTAPYYEDIMAGARFWGKYGPVFWAVVESHPKARSHEGRFRESPQ